MSLDKGTRPRERSLMEGPVATFSVTRVQPRTSKGHHRPVIAFNFLSLDMNSLFKKQIKTHKAVRLESMENARAFYQSNK